MCEPLLKNLPQASTWANLYIDKLGIYVDKSIVLSEFSVQCVESVSVDILQVAIAYLYRRDITGMILELFDRFEGKCLMTNMNSFIWSGSIISWND